MKFGAHESIAGGVFNAIYFAQKATCDLVQMFNKSNSQWRAKKLETAEVDKFFAAQQETAQRLLVEVQRSLDLWERTWPTLALDHIAVHAGDRTPELAGWLGPKLGQTVLPLDVSAFFPGFEGGSDADRLLCWPLLGVLMRSEHRKL
jgi:hypothetical protein